VSPPRADAFSCAVAGCDATFDHRWRLNKHRKTHDRPFVCAVEGCARRFGDRRNLAVHARIHRGERSEECSFCARSFADPSTLRRHIENVHAKGVAVKPFVCRRCHRAFAKRHQLRAHLLSHLDRVQRTTFGCEKCAVVLSTKSNLRRHRRKVHGKTQG